MKKHKQFWIVITFAIVCAAPFVPVALSLAKLRSSVVLDQPVEWQEGRDFTFTHDAVASGDYEIRIDTDESKWEPTAKLSWSYSKISLNAAEAKPEVLASRDSTELIITRPLDKIHIAQDKNAKYQLSLKFLNSNPDRHEVRVKVAQDREALLAQSSRDFTWHLAISLVLLVLLWKPLMSLPSGQEPKSVAQNP